MNKTRNPGVLERVLFLAAAAVSAGMLGACSSHDPSFSSDVQPILAKNCNECHSEGKPGFVATGFDTTTYQSLMKGGKYGPLVKPGDAFTSALNMLVEGRANPAIQMPHGKEKLSERELEILKDWVDKGAKNN